MNDALIIGLMAGMIAGAIVATTFKPVQNVVNAGKDELKKTMDKLK